jgi:uroporphyrin-3 C-methyltransferase
MHEEQNIEPKGAGVNVKAQPNPQRKETGLTKNRMSSSGRFFIFLTFILAGSGLALAGFLYLQLVQNSPLDKVIAESDAARQTLSTKVTDQLSSATATMEQRQLALQSQLDEKIEQRLSQAEIDLQTGLELVTASKPTTPNKWRLAEAGYLLREANRSLIMQRDTVFALRALTSAEAILQDLGDLAPFPLRAKLADDIASLARVEVVNIEEIYIRLETLKGDIPSGLSKQNNRALTEPKGAPPTQVWWQQILDRLKSLIRVSSLVEETDNQTLPKLLPTHEVVVLARLRISLAIEQAQLALLQGQEQVYQASLLRAKTTTIEYFDVNGSLEMQLLANIQELSVIDLTPELTDISASLEMLSKAELAAE